MDKEELLALKIKQVLRERRIKQKDLAVKLGFSDAHLSQLLHGKNAFTIKTLYKLENILNVELINVDYPLQLPCFRCTITQLQCQPSAVRVSK